MREGFEEFSEARLPEWKLRFEIRGVAAASVRHKNRPMLAKAAAASGGHANPTCKNRVCSPQST